MKISDRKIGAHRCTVVAEAGTNHASPNATIRFMRAQSLIWEAWKAGADAVKFQIFTEDEPLFCPCPDDERRLRRWSNTVLGRQEWMSLAAFAHDLGLAFVGSAFQHGAADIVDAACDVHKVAVRAITSYPMDKYKKPMICSTATPQDEIVLTTTLAFRQGQGLVLHCRPVYPCPPSQARLERIAVLKKSFGQAGYSDHCKGPWMAIKAMSLGAVLVEKHFTLFDPGTDPDGSHAVDRAGLETICLARNNWADEQE